MNGSRRRPSARGVSPEPQQRSDGYYRQYPSNNQHMNVRNDMNFVDRGLRNRRHSDVSWRYSGRRSSSLQESEHEYYDSPNIISTVPQFTPPRARWIRQKDQKATADIRYRIARAASIAITSIIFLCICFEGIEIIGMGVFRWTTSWYFNNEVKDVDTPSSSINAIVHEKVKKKRHIDAQHVSGIKGDRGLRGVSDGEGTVIRPKNEEEEKIIESADKIKNQKSVKDAVSYKINQLDQNLGNDATTDFFYAGKSIHDEEDVPFSAFSYASLPFSDCNQFALSAWVYLSPEAERKAPLINSNEDKPPRVILTTKTEREGKGCISNLFGTSASSYPSTGVILYALPHHGDRDNNDKTYRIMLEYSVANESRCRTLAGFKPVFIQEGEWHHGKFLGFAKYCSG